MNGFKFLLGFISIVASAETFGEARVLALSTRGGHVAVTHLGVEQWRESERTCIFQGTTNVGCGTVHKVQARGAVVKLDQPSYRVRVGDLVRRSDSRAPATAKAAVSDIDDAMILERTQFASRPRGIFNLTAGLGGGATYRFPQVAIQMGIGRHFVLGVGPLLYSASSGDDSPATSSQSSVRAATTQSASTKPELSGIGGLLTVTGYLNDRYSGFFVSGGAGMASLTLKNNGADQSKTMPFFLLTSGLRFAWQNALNIGVSAGVTTAPSPSATANTFADSGIAPLLMVDVGFNF